MNKEELDLICKTAIDVWGEEAQVAMLHEEIGELMQAINKFRRKKTNTTENITEEIADLELMLHQMKYLFHIKEEAITNIKKQKCEHLKQRLNIK